MSDEGNQRYVAFRGVSCVARGTLEEVVTAAWRVAAGDPNAPILCFDATTSHPVEIDLRGSLDETVARVRASSAAAGVAFTPPPVIDEAAPSGTRGPGRPRLGVVAREVTLLPRHWEWLNQQPGGASVALRKLVEGARRVSAEEGRRRSAQEATYRFMLAMGGNLPDFEEATRALFAGDERRFELLIEGWPSELRSHVSALARVAFDVAPAE